MQRFLSGNAIYRLPDGDKSFRTTITAYLENGRWRFSPASLGPWWERDHLSKAQLEGDHADEIEVFDSKNAPVRIESLHAHVDKEDLSSLKLSFQLANHSEKAIKAYDLVIFDSKGEGSQLVADGRKRIKSGESITIDNLTASRFYSYCDGRVKEHLILKSVTFEDDSEWRNPQTRLPRVKRHMLY